VVQCWQWKRAKNQGEIAMLAENLGVERGAVAGAVASSGREPGKFFPGKLPPTPRDLEVHRLVRIRQVPTRLVAELTGISQTRVCQVAAKVESFLADLAPGEKDEARLRQLVCVEECIAHERLDRLYEENMEAWRASQGEVQVTRESPSLLGASRTIRTEPRFGDTRYTIAAMRIARVQMRIPNHGLLAKAYALAEEQYGDDPEHSAAAWDWDAMDEAIQGEYSSLSSASGASAAPPQPSAKTASSHPLDGACSRNATEQALHSRMASLLKRTSLHDQATYDDGEFGPSMLEAAEMTPVQTGPERLPLNRKERRKRQRELERKKGRTKNAECRT
jgi:hypothetical protein